MKLFDDRLWLCMRYEPVLNLLNMINAIPIVYCLLSAVHLLLSSHGESVASKALLIELDQFATCSVIHLNQLPHAAFQGLRLILPR